MAKKSDFEEWVDYYTELIENGVYHEDEKTLEALFNKLASKQELTQDEWISIACAFLDKIYNDLSEDAYKDAIRIRCNQQYVKDWEVTAKEIVKFYKRNRHRYKK